MWKTRLATTIIAAVVILFSQTPLFACNVCHSKNPKMVAMHSKEENRVCFRCHGTGKIKPKKEQPKQKATDPLCNGCHKK